MENKLEGIGQFTGRVREMFSQLADLDDELDGMGPTGRDTDSLQSQAEDVRSFLSKLQGLKADIEASESECKKMLEDEGSPDLLGLKRELETLSKQCSKLTERGRSRQEQVETTLARVEDFYSRLKELTHMTTAAEESEALQWVVGTEVETINQQLADFKVGPCAFLTLFLVFEGLSSAVVCWEGPMLGKTNVCWVGRGCCGFVVCLFFAMLSFGYSKILLLWRIQNNCWP